MLFFNDRVFVPKCLQKMILSKLHESHFGIKKTKARARPLFYWKEMNLDIEDFVNSCKTCMKFGPGNINNPMIIHETPALPFDKIASDILSHGKDSYLV